MLGNILSLSGTFCSPNTKMMPFHDTHIKTSRNKYRNSTCSLLVVLVLLNIGIIILLFALAVFFYGIGTGTGQ